VLRTKQVHVCPRTTSPPTSDRCSVSLFATDETWDGNWSRGGFVESAMSFLTMRPASGSTKMRPVTIKCHVNNVRSVFARQKTFHCTCLTHITMSSICCPATLLSSFCIAPINKVTKLASWKFPSLMRPHKSLLSASLQCKQELIWSASLHCSPDVFD
jgi:hypothetical protein